MYNEKLVKNLFNQAGVKVEIENFGNGFIAKVQGKNNIYVWNNEITNKETFYNNITNNCNK